MVTIVDERIRPTKIDTIKGCEATVELAKSDFYPGEIVQGQLTVSVAAPVECQAFTLTLVGVDKLHWETGGEDSEYLEKVHDVVKQQVALLQPSQTTLPVGQHVYPFAFPLPPVLPASGHTLPLWGSAKRQLVYYDVSVCIHPKAAAKTKTVARQSITVHAIPLLAEAYAGTSATNSVSIPVRRCCFKQGTCELTLSTDKDMCDINTGALTMVVTIKNDTNLAVHSLRVVLTHNLVIHIPGDAAAKTPRYDTSPFYKQTLQQVVDPHTAKDDISFPISMADVRASFDKENQRLMRRAFLSFTPSTLVPTTDFVFASVQFRVSVNVRFSSFFGCSEVSAELPVRLLHLAPQSSAHATSVPTTMNFGKAALADLESRTNVRGAVVVTDIN